MLKARSRTVDVFLSHSAADKKLAERLSRGLDAHGLSVWLDRRELTPGSDLRREIEEAIQKADHILLLIGHREPDEAQQLTWRVALEAVWQDPEKRFIPVLHHGAAVTSSLESLQTPDDAVSRGLESEESLTVDDSRGRPG
jgi:hypothetical protein